LFKKNEYENQQQLEKEQKHSNYFYLKNYQKEKVS